MRTPHIELDDRDKIAKTVLMPGDPLRAKFIAETFLKDVYQFNTVRNMFGYTGTYKGKKISVMGSGMGMPSIGIYSYELFKFYDVDTIIRVGSAGAYTKDLNLYDVVLATHAWSESSYAKTMGLSSKKKLKATTKVNQALRKSARKLGVELHEGVIHSSDVFYRLNPDEFKEINEKHQALAVEMESFALFANAIATNKQAACILTISDSLVTKEVTTSEEREQAFTKMMEIALNA